MDCRLVLRVAGLLLVSTAFVGGGCATNNSETGNGADGGDAAAMNDGDGSVTCTSNSDCDDGTFCNGQERCMPAHPEADSDGCITGGVPCDDAGVCDEGAQECVMNCPDADGDGFMDAACGGSDCDDADPNRFPGNTEICDIQGHDEDCDPETLGPDQDGDGFVATSCCNVQPDGSVKCGADCDDTAMEVNPDAPENCNGIDDNCDGQADEGVQSAFYPDCDGDRAGRMGSTATMACMPPDAIPEPCDDLLVAGWAVNTTDCDDTDGSANPGAPEVCNGADDDCDGMTDEGVKTSFYPDCDGDGVGKAFSTPTKACEAPSESPAICADSDVGAWSRKATDCDDSDPGVNPSADEICDGVDNDCDGTLDPSRCDCNSGNTRQCGEPDGEGGFVTTGQCEVGSQTCIEGSWGSCSAAFPEEETCDGQDEDCDGTADEGTLTDCWEDADRDGYAPSGAAHDEVCGGCGTGWTDIDPSESADCNDSDDQAYPGQTEWFPEPMADGSYDYNCDGSETERWSAYYDSGGCGTSGGSECDVDGAVCVTIEGWDPDVPYTPECGQEAGWYSETQTFCGCVHTSDVGNYCKANPESIVSKAQECR